MLNQAQENTQRSFGEFMDQRAQDGVRLLSTRGGIRQINLGYVGSYVYWFMELFLVAALPVFVAHLMAKEPFCATCNRWKKGQQLGYLDCAPKLAVDALEQGCFARLAACNPTAAEAGLRLSVYVCPGCKDQESVVAYLVQIQKDNNGEKSKEIAFITFPGESLSFFEKLFESTRELL